MQRVERIDRGMVLSRPEETYGLDSGGVELPVLDMVGELVQCLALLLQVLGVRRRVTLMDTTPRRRGCLLVARRTHRLCRTLSLAA
jgi:hypothetical protein